MPSNSTYACFTCRIGFRQTAVCPTCRTEMTYLGRKIRIPKKNNVRMWKRMERGELRWDRKHKAKKLGSPSEVVRGKGWIKFIGSSWSNDDKPDMPGR